MKKNIYKSIDLASSACSNSILKTVKAKPDAQICYATGNSVVRLYELLVKEAKKQQISFADTSAFQLDEYYVKLKNNKLYMRNIVFSLWDELHVNYKNQYVHKITGDEEADINFYRNRITSDFDLMILGVGLNGHLAYNEPGSRQDVDFQVVNLEDQSIQNTLGYGITNDEHLPTRGITIGLQTIYNSKKIVLIALGEEKKKVLEKFNVCKEFDPGFPISILHDHQNLEIYTDFEF